MSTDSLSALIGLTPSINGQCLCGRSSYICRKSPVWSVNCHCHGCQKLSGAPFVSAFSVPAESFGFTGETIAFQRPSEAGHSVTTTHCAACGTRLFAQSAGARHLVNVFASTLVDAGSFVAISNVYLSEAAAWAQPPSARFNFEKMPKA
jgi:hypothetical protein